MKKADQVLTKKELIAVKNAVTGELENKEIEMNIYVKNAGIEKWKDKYITFFQAINLSLVREITPITSKLLLYLCSVVGYGNVITKSINEIAEVLQYSRRNVERGLKELEERKIIAKQKHPEDKRCMLIILNPKQSWKGYKKDHKKAITSPNQLNLFGDDIYLVKLNNEKINNDFNSLDTIAKTIRDKEVKQINDKL